MKLSIIIPIALFIQSIGQVNAIYESNKNDHYKILEKDEPTPEYKEWIVPVTLFDSLGPPSIYKQYRSTKGLFPPRYSIGALSIPGIHNEKSSIQDEHHLFTFDLGNPGQSIFLTEDCKGCFSDLEPTSGCPKIVPTCDSDDLIYEMFDPICWPSHPDQYLPKQSFTFVTNQFCPYKDGYGDTYAGDIDNVPVCIACFDGGDHSRFYSFAEMDLSLVDATVTVRTDTDANQISTPKLRHNHKKDKDEAQNHIIYSYLSKPAPVIQKYQFGALVRTVPLKDRIWSNIGIGANSSFMNQLPAHSFMFDFDYYDVKKNNDNIVMTDQRNAFESTITHKERIIFNPNFDRYQTWDKSPYVIHHHRHHNIQRFCFSATDCLHSDAMEIPSNIDFFMDTGNDGISIADTSLQNYLADQTGGMWMKDESDPNNYGVGRLFVPYSKTNAPDMTLIMDPEIPITLPGYAWVFDEMQMEFIKTYLVYDEDHPLSIHEGMYPTIFVTDTQNILGLPFLAAPGYSFVFEDLELMLYIHYKSVQTPFESSI